MTDMRLKCMPVEPNDEGLANAEREPHHIPAKSPH